MKDKVVVTVIGGDQIGIVAKVTALMEKYEMNIIDISQSVFESKTFVMTMLAVVDLEKLDVDTLQKAFTDLGTQIGVQIYVQHEDIFHAMHRI